ncbi:MAG: fatty acyl-AMP ligase [Salinisphaera sp.]|jgi:acyl-CoA synthetase (AMP-forming)/AMP-acid ligase II|nr:fatty acyl-AMP ligase [Salinisphaera sp.]
MNVPLTEFPQASRSDAFAHDSIPARLMHWAREQPDAVAYTFLDGNDSDTCSLTFQELRARAVGAASALCAEGVEPGDRVILLCDTGLDFIAAFLGCLLAGVIAVPVQPPRKPEEMTRLMAILNAAHTKFAWVDDAIQVRTSSLFAGGDLRVRMIGHSEILTTVIENDFIAAMPAPNAIAFLQFTSGSTGTPRGVMVTHANLIANQHAIRHAFGHDDTTTVVSWLPHYHDMGLVGMLLQPLFIGRPCYFMSPAAFVQRPLRWLQAISRYGATTSGGPNFGYELCVRSITDEQLATSRLDLSNWRVAYNGAEPVRAETLHAFADRFAPYGFREEAFLPCYGMAETTLLISGGPPGRALIVRNRPSMPSDSSTALSGLSDGPSPPPPLRVVSCGQVAQHHELIIVDAEALPLPDGQTGEIYLRGPSVAAGYWDSPNETAATFSAMLCDGQGPYLRTGDIGFTSHGELFITGRLKSLIIFNGRNLFPTDIENAVRYSHAAFRPQCAVLDLREHTEQIVVLQEVDPHAARDFDADTLTRHVRKVANNHFSIQVEVFLTTQRLPLTSSGKLRREACKKLFLDGQLRPFVANCATTP